MNLTEFANCRICNKLYDQQTRIPLILPCGHTYCKQCINQELLEKQYFSCIQCDQVHKEIQINSLVCNKQNILVANQIRDRTPEIMCDGHKNKPLEFFCQKENALCCGNCILMRHQEHLNLVMEIPDIKKEIENLKQILEIQIIQKSSQILDEINSFLIPGGEKQILFGSNVQQMAEKVFQFIKEVTLIEPETNYLKHISLISKTGLEEYLKQTNEIEELKTQQVKINQDLEVELQNFKQELEQFKQVKQEQEQTIQKVNQIEQNQKNQEQILELFNQKFVGREVAVQFNPNKNNQNIQLSENNKAAKQTANTAGCVILDLQIQTDKIYEIEYQIISISQQMIGVVTDCQN